MWWSFAVSNIGLAMREADSSHVAVDVTTSQPAPSYLVYVANPPRLLAIFQWDDRPD
jgi:hypothetical protein